jgi:hypothetical protein
MKGLVVEPSGNTEVRDFGTLEDVRRAVSGRTEMVVGARFVVYFNEDQEGRSDSEANHRATAMLARLGSPQRQPLLGPMVVFMRPK